MLNSNIQDILNQYKINGCISKIIYLKNDIYHFVYEIHYDNEIYILKCINQYNKFLVSNINILINKGLLGDIIKNRKGDYISTYNNKLFIIYEKHIGENILHTYKHIDYENILLKLIKWHKIGLNNLDGIKNINEVYINNQGRRIKEIKSNIGILKNNLQEYSTSKILKKYFEIYNATNYIFTKYSKYISIIHNNITLENIIIDKFNIPIIIDYDTITIGVILEDTSQYFYSLLAHGVQMNQVEEYFNIINKEFKISKKDQILYLERTLLDTLLLFSLENENKYFIDNNLSTVKQIISILNKDFKYEL